MSRKPKRAQSLHGPATPTSPTSPTSSSSGSGSSGASAVLQRLSLRGKRTDGMPDRNDLAHQQLLAQQRQRDRHRRTQPLPLLPEPEEEGDSSGDRIPDDSSEGSLEASAGASPSSPRATSPLRNARGYSPAGHRRCSHCDDVDASVLYCQLCQAEFCSRCASEQCQHLQTSLAWPGHLPDAHLVGGARRHRAATISHTGAPYAGSRGAPPVPEDLDYVEPNKASPSTARRQPAKPAVDSAESSDPLAASTSSATATATAAATAAVLLSRLGLPDDSMSVGSGSHLGDDLGSSFGSIKSASGGRSTLSAALVAASAAAASTPAAGAPSAPSPPSSRRLSPTSAYAFSSGPAAAAAAAAVGAALVKTESVYSSSSNRNAEASPATYMSQVVLGAANPPGSPAPKEPAAAHEYLDFWFKDKDPEVAPPVCETPPPVVRRRSSQLAEDPWFLTGDPNAVHKLLTPHKNGAFIIRNGVARPDTLSLSVLYRGEVKKFTISKYVVVNGNIDPTQKVSDTVRPVAGRRKYVIHDRAFACLRDLVKHFADESLAVLATDDRIHTSLTKACGDSHYQEPFNDGDDDDDDEEDEEGEDIVACRRKPSVSRVTPLSPLMQQHMQDVLRQSHENPAADALARLALPDAGDLPDGPLGYGANGDAANGWAVGANAAPPMVNVWQQAGLLSEPEVATPAPATMRSPRDLLTNVSLV